MRVNEEIRKELIKNLRIRLQSFTRRMNRIIGRMTRVQSVEKLMKLKKEMLLEWLQLIPLERYFCYFCIKDNLERESIDDMCKKCEYAKIHGVCTEDDSDFYKIEKVLTILEKKINKLYVRRGERYD